MRKLWMLLPIAVVVGLGWLLLGLPGLTLGQGFPPSYPRPRYLYVDIDKVWTIETADMGTFYTDRQPKAGAAFYLFDSAGTNATYYPELSNFAGCIYIRDAVRKTGVSWATAYYDVDSILICGDYVAYETEDWELIDPYAGLQEPIEWDVTHKWIRDSAGNWTIEDTP